METTETKQHWFKVEDLETFQNFKDNLKWTKDIYGGFILNSTFKYKNEDTVYSVVFDTYKNEMFILC